MTLIKCPKCGREYLPCEIFLPNYFLGKATNIVREGKRIVSYSGIKQDLGEEFVCEDCGTSFIVNAKVEYEVVEDPSKSFNEDYSSTIFKDRISLKEED